MNRKTLGSFAATLTLAASLSASTAAEAAGPVTVTSPTCGTIKISNSSSTEMLVDFDSGNSEFVAPRSTVTLRGRSNQGMPGGGYSWLSGASRADFRAPAGHVTVKPCPGGPRRPVDGDQNGDGKADVLGIQAKTGDLYYYRMTDRGLASGIKAGTGWKSMVFMQQVNEIEGGPSGNYLIAVRSDGTVWRYDNRGYGKFANGRQVGKGLKGHTNFAITATNDPFAFGEHSLLSTKGDELFFSPVSKDSVMDPMSLGAGWGATRKLMATRNFDGDNLGDLISIETDGSMFAQTAQGTRQVGSGWGAMQTVTSPGSLNGDKYSDLVARRSDGNLYKYLNQGGRWGAATKIGQNWNGIRLLA
ncbi:MAG: hypothetical protein WAV52_00210 [Luteococcus japonicus]